MDLNPVSNEEFERMIEQAVESLPLSIQEKMENVEIVLEDKIEASPNLFGLYQGVPQTKRGIYYSLVLPDKITIFKKTIERYARGREHLTYLVQHVVRHEIAHHFGYSDEDLQKK